MIGQDFNNPALGDTAMFAALNHQFQLLFKCDQAADALLHFLKPGFGYVVSGTARLIRIVLQSDKRPNCVNFKAKLSGVANKGESSNVGGGK